MTGGYNDFDFSWPLKPGESLSTPPYYGGFSSRGFGEASRLMHRLERNEILPDHAHPHVRPVLYNSWEATTFDVNEPGQKVLAEKAAKLGVELFVMDDGWFGKRNDDHAGLGDWYVNPQKFPQGLQPLISYVNSLGMDFGLWFEPEMVNPDSDLYRHHPDWAMNFPGRPRSEARNQLVLNMARDDVKEYIFGVLDKMLSENNIKYIKWDMNRHFGEPGWAEVPVAEQKEIWVKYVRNVYEIIDRLRAKHPNLEIESCSGGGGRLDLGILERVNVVWTSDNTEAFDRLGIQEGFTYRLHPQGHVGLGYRCAQSERALHAAAISFPRRHARRAGHRRQPEQVDSRRFCSRYPHDQHLQEHPRNRAAGRPLPLVLSPPGWADRESIRLRRRKAGGFVRIPPLPAVSAPGAHHLPARA